IGELRNLDPQGGYVRSQPWLRPLSSQGIHLADVHIVRADELISLRHASAPLVFLLLQHIRWDTGALSDPTNESAIAWLNTNHFHNLLAHVVLPKMKVLPANVIAKPPARLPTPLVAALVARRTR